MKRPRKAVGQLFEAQAIINVTVAKLAEGGDFDPKDQITEALVRLLRYERANTGRVIKRRGKLTWSISRIRFLLGARHRRYYSQDLCSYLLRLVYKALEQLQTFNELVL
jgi:hypothetical protein